MNDALRFGLQLTLYGMGLVFFLLALLWGLISLLLRLDRPPAPAQPAPPSDTAPTSQLSAPPASVPGQPSPDLLAAIGVAVLAQRSGRSPKVEPGMTPAGSWVEAGRNRQIRNWHPRSHA